MSANEVGELTYAEYRQMTKTYHDHLRFTKTLDRNVSLNAIVNALRDKNTSFMELFNDDSEEKSTEDILNERRELFGEDQ
ncbi:hypothetical protein ABFV99_14775 [Cytobacillus horneckiae]|uniref:hypothetical protein n=1 Tax=Cytobacillus horneckiae TaxID=549687 RepID=UPI0034CE0AFF